MKLNSLIHRLERPTTYMSQPRPVAYVSRPIETYSFPPPAMPNHVPLSEIRQSFRSSVRSNSFTNFHPTPSFRPTFSDPARRVDPNFTLRAPTHQILDLWEIFVAPYVKGYEHLTTSLNQASLGYSLLDRVAHFGTALVLFIPLVNIVFHIVLRILFPIPEASNQNADVEEAFSEPLTQPQRNVEPSRSELQRPPYGTDLFRCGPFSLPPIVYAAPSGFPSELFLTTTLEMMKRFEADQIASMTPEMKSILIGLAERPRWIDLRAVYAHEVHKTLGLLAKYALKESSAFLPRSNQQLMPFNQYNQGIQTPDVVFFAPNSNCLIRVEGKINTSRFDRELTSI